MGLLGFLSSHRDDILPLIVQHLLVVGWALPIAMILGIGAGIALVDRPRLSALALGLAGGVSTVPSIALLGVMIPVLAPIGMGVGRPPAIVALALYSLLPILGNTVVGLEGVPASVREAASGMGLTDRAVLWRVRLPLAMPTILAGVRTSVVMGIGVTAIAAYIGAGGLGRWVFGGIRQTYPAEAAAGALLISLLALAADNLIAAAQRVVSRRLGLDPGPQAAIVREGIVR